jgi:hypothetical protein
MTGVAHKMPAIATHISRELLIAEMAFQIFQLIGMVGKFFPADIAAVLERSGVHDLVFRFVQFFPNGVQKYANAPEFPPWN